MITTIDEKMTHHKQCQLRRYRQHTCSSLGLHKVYMLWTLHIVFN